MRFGSPGPPAPPALLVTGGIVTVLFSLVFGTRHAWMQYLVVGVVTGLVTFSILLVDAMQYPFSGDVSIRPEAYELVVASMRERAAAAVPRQ
jgi:fluoride ion exporter CrcB/FEX